MENRDHNENLRELLLLEKQISEKKKRLDLLMELKENGFDKEILNLSKELDSMITRYTTLKTEKVD